MHDVQTNIHSRNKIIVRSESHLLVQAVPLEQHGLEATLRSQAVLQSFESTLGCCAFGNPVVPSGTTHSRV